MKILKGYLKTSLWVHGKIFGTQTGRILRRIPEEIPERILRILFREIFEISIF